MPPSELRGLVQAAITSRIHSYEWEKRRLSAKNKPLYQQQLRDSPHLLMEKMVISPCHSECEQVRKKARSGRHTKTRWRVISVCGAGWSGRGLLHNFSPACFSLVHALPKMHLQGSKIGDTNLSDEAFFADLENAAQKFFHEVQNDANRQDAMNARLHNLNKGGAIYIG
jgi:hypothetical protein